MKPFNLEEALAGKPVITRDGREVTQLVKFDANYEKYTLYGVVNNIILRWTNDGIFYNKADLFMKSEKKSIWVNAYHDEDGIMLGVEYKSKEDAIKAIDNENGNYIKTIEITNEK